MELCEEQLDRDHVFEEVIMRKDDTLSSLTEEKYTRTQQNIMFIHQTRIMLYAGVGLGHREVGDLLSQVTDC